jgi:dihydrofolate reductase
MIISHIVARSENFVIANNNKLPWHLPADLKYFKDVTMGHHVLMGRKNFEAEGKLLKGRTNIILTRQKDYKVDGASVFTDLEKAIEFARVNGESELFVIGGSEIYKQTMEFTDKIYLTIIHNDFGGNIFYPELNPNEWTTISERRYNADEKNAWDHTYYIYSRNLKKG